MPWVPANLTALPDLRSPFREVLAFPFPGEGVPVKGKTDEKSADALFPVLALYALLVLLGLLCS